MAAPIEVHYWPTPNGYKVTIALEEMALPYTIVPVNIGKGEQFKPDFLAISPNNRMPAIVDPDGPGGKRVSVFESGAILQYLARKTGSFYGADEHARIDVDQWLFWQMANLGPMSGQANHFRSVAPAILRDQRQVAYGAIRYTDEVHRLWGVLDTLLADRPFMAGDYSIADMASYPWMLSSKTHGIDMREFPKVAAWMDRMGAREAVKRAIDYGLAMRARNLAATSASDADRARAIMFGQRARKS